MWCLFVHTQVKVIFTPVWCYCHLFCRLCLILFLFFFFFFAALRTENTCKYDHASNHQMHLRQVSIGLVSECLISFLLFFCITPPIPNYKVKLNRFAFFASDFFTLQLTTIIRTIDKHLFNLKYNKVDCNECG